ncbi:MAG: NAD(P)H-hydrate dehydratase [Sulfurovaceae bacterium]|nr:NAD(P)H-hydrate dehydratase [Sulfurovaceae bacterium]
MQKVFHHCGDMDKRCYEKYHLSEEILMEHAALGMDRIIRDRFNVGSSVLIVSGKGNNGADGIALARLLYGDYEVRLYIPLEVKSEMAQLQLVRALAIGIKTVDEMRDADVVVDALLGSGVEGELGSEILELIEQLNALNGYKIACDMPTGISIDGRVLSNAFAADMTVTMGAYKEALFLDEAKDFVGKIVRTDLGLHASLYEDESDMFVLEKSDLSLPLRKKLSTHKGTFGHAAIFCGEKEGASVISGEAALRFGAGLVTLVMQQKYFIPPYIMHSSTLPKNTTAIALGMGLGHDFEESFLDKYVLANSLPLVLDADALHSPKLLSLLKQNGRSIVVTPHPREFVVMWKILTGEEISVLDLQSYRFEYAKRFSYLYPNAVLLLKGANILIAHKGYVYINPLGCSNLSKGGSGDVLSGLIVALLAQGYDALHSAVQGSLALTLASQKYDGANYAMTSMDVVNNLAYLEDL